MNEVISRNPESNTTNFIESIELNYLDNIFLKFNVSYNDKQKPTNIIELIKLLEDILREFIDLLVNRYIYYLKFDYNFYLVGGKALSMFIPTIKSFDFDIHTSNELLDFSSAMCNSLNNIISNKPILREYLILLLLKYGFITENEKEHYINEDLFKYGYRNDSTNKIVGVFYFIKNLFKYGYRHYSTSETPKILGVFLNLKLKPDLVKNRDKTNNSILNNYNDCYLMPISDINSDNLFFQDKLKEELLRNFSVLNYAPLEYLVYNIIAYLDKIYEEKQTIITKKKIEELNSKLKEICNLKKLREDILLELIESNNLDKLFEDKKDLTVKHLSTKNTLRELTLSYNLTTTKINTGDFKYYTIIKQIFVDFIQKLNYKKSEIQIELTNLTILDNKTINMNNSYDPTEYIDKLNEYFKLLSKEEMNIIKDYTASDYYNYINYSIYKYFNLTYPYDYNIKCNLLSSIITNSPPDTKPDADFIVYSIRHMFIFSDSTISTIYPNTFFLDNVKIDQIIFLPYYLSTSYTTNYSYMPFVHQNCILLRIKIKAKSKQFLDVSSYAFKESEKEIIIDKNSSYKVLNISLGYIKFVNQLQLVTVVDLQLLELTDLEFIQEIRESDKYVEDKKDQTGRGKINLINVSPYHNYIFKFNKIYKFKKENINYINIFLIDVTKKNIDMLDEFCNFLELRNEILDNYKKIYNLSITNIEQSKIQYSPNYPNYPMIKGGSKQEKVIYKYIKYKTKYLNLKHNKIL